MFKRAKQALENAFYGVTSNDMQTIKRANYIEVQTLLNRYSSEEGARILIETQLHEYKHRSLLEYTTSLLTNEVKDMLPIDARGKAINVLTVPSSGHTVSDVIRTFTMVYDHCNQHASSLLAQSFTTQLDTMLSYKMSHEWKGNENPGAEAIKEFIIRLASSHIYVPEKVQYHFEIAGYTIDYQGENYYILSSADADMSTASFDIDNAGVVLIG